MNAESKKYNLFIDQKLDEYEQEIEDNIHLHTALPSKEEAKHRAITNAAAMNHAIEKE